MIITLTNNQIYTYANLLMEQFSNTEIKLPIKVNFYLQKNKTKLLELAQEIEKQRIEIAQEYGVLNEETQQYDIPKGKVAEASKKINELFELTQEVPIYKVKLDAFGDILLTSQQMDALLFMIEEDEE